MTEHLEQPMPIPNTRPSIQSLVRADLEQRELVGISRYGTPLQPHNGRDALRDLYEELLDGACYARQAMEERAQPAVGATTDTEGRPIPESVTLAALRALEWEEGSSLDYAAARDVAQAIVDAWEAERAPMVCSHGVALVGTARRTGCPDCIAACRFQFAMNSTADPTAVGM